METCEFILNEKYDGTPDQFCGAVVTHHCGGGAAPEVLLCAKHAVIVNREEGDGEEIAEPLSR